MSTYLSEWHDDGNRTVICFRSLSTLLQFVGRKRAFRFLHVLTGRIESAGGIAHFHMDPEAHDDRTINTLAMLFDAVVEAAEDGGWTVSLP